MRKWEFNLIAAGAVGQNGVSSTVGIQFLRACAIKY